MIDLNQYIDPVCLDKPGVEPLKGSSAFPHNVVVNTGNEPIGDLDGFAVAILGVPDDRSSVNTGAAMAPDAVRKSLYTFSRLPGRMMSLTWATSDPELHSVTQSQACATCSFNCCRRTLCR